MQKITVHAVHSPYQYKFSCIGQEWRKLLHFIFHAVTRTLCFYVLLSGARFNNSIALRRFGATTFSLSRRFKSEKIRCDAWVCATRNFISFMMSSELFKLSFGVGGEMQYCRKFASHERIKVSCSQSVNKTSTLRTHDVSFRIRLLEAFIQLWNLICASTPKTNKQIDVTQSGRRHPSSRSITEIKISRCAKIFLITFLSRWKNATLNV